MLLAAAEPRNKMEAADESLLEVVLVVFVGGLVVAEIISLSLFVVR